MKAELSERALPPRFVADRYEVVEELGRGGAAVVYRVQDRLSQRELALKQLSVERHGQHTNDLAVLFQREFHTLAQLSHPRIIEVFDFGIEDGGPYYTMELLSGGDLRSRTPLAWPDACRLIYDVCSSLALIHARRWVHRDVTPLNIRCTQDGRAKLIDFGAMMVMGPCEVGVGTPPFTAPEVIQRALLDARTDLFSVGATLYYVLTGRNAYPARRFAELPLLWQKPPAPPSAYVDVPADLDALVLSLLRPDPLARPSSAFDVMQRLAALAGIVEPEIASVSHAYLAAPNLVARDEAVLAIDVGLEAARTGRGGALVLAAERGLGRSRMLEVCALKAKLSGAVVLRGRAGRRQEFALVEKLLVQLLETLPDQTLNACSAAAAEMLLSAGEGGPKLKPLSSAGPSRVETHAALLAWLRALCRAETLVITVDDLESVDEASVVVLAALLSEPDDLRLFVLAVRDEGVSAPLAATAIEVLCSRAKLLSLAPLTTDQMFQLVRSVFGEVQHLGVLSDALSRISAGRPRVAMELLQHLVDTGGISYRAGEWTLPAELGDEDLPRSAASALAQQLARVNALARSLLELQVLSSHSDFAREDYARVLPDLPAHQVNDALSELLAAGILVRDGSAYRIAHRGYSAAVERDIPAQRRRSHHQVLGNLYAEGRGADVLRHWLASGSERLAIERALAMVANDADTNLIVQGSRMPVVDVCAVFVDVLKAAENSPCPTRGLADLRRVICALSTSSDEAYFYRVTPAWLLQLVHDSGLAAFRALDPALEPGVRLAQALKQANAAYVATPEAERAYTVPEAIRGLLNYAVAGIAIGSRTQDSVLLESLPPLLEPFAATSPLVHAIWQNTLATCESRAWAQPELAYRRWQDVYHRLSEVNGSDIPRLEVIKNAVAYGIGSVAAFMGLASASEWVELVERDPRQRVNALYLRRVIALQRGDAAEAESFRRKAEIAALQASTRQMLSSSGAELPAHIAAHDLAGVRQNIARLAPLSEQWPGWRSSLRGAEGYFELLRGDHQAAQRAFEEARAIADPDCAEPTRSLGPWLTASTGLVETLILQGRLGEARELGLSVLAFCAERNIEVVAFSMARALAVAEAKLKDFASAKGRLERVIATQEELGVEGVFLGVSHETRARVAIWEGAWEDVGTYAAVAAREYRHGKGSLLAGRYERLMDEVRKSLRRSGPMHAELALVSSVYGAFPASAMNSRVTDAFHSCSTTGERSDMALDLMCRESRAAIGHLFLNKDGDFELAASRGALSGSELAAKVRAYLLAQRENDLAAVVTETVHGLDGRFLHDGVQYMATLLACSLEGHVCDVGVVVLASDGQHALVELDPSLLEGVALKLLQSGDAVSLVTRPLSKA